jgi:eukaryotic-like serine/threonine-protein kinase
VIGSRLAHYDILDLLGRGGMGEVYRARDTKLGREVAVKLLPEDFAADADRLARFNREAKVLAALNHPNLAQIYGLEFDQGRHFLVMELAEGDDLSAIIKRGPVACEDAVAIAQQIAAGLEEAHERGITHRDLKPANIKVSKDGKVKVLDFGLAQALAGETTGEEESSSAMTLTAAMTRHGLILGTAAYMSPEQARGKPVDRRADIWAFGVVLFEMLSGQRLFDGETITDTLAEVIKQEPDWQKLPPDTPAHVERVLRRCLVKDPSRRLRDIGEARIRLVEVPEESGVLRSDVLAPDAEVSRRGWRPWLPWALLAISVAALAAVVALRPWSGEPAPRLHLAVPVPDDKTFVLDGSAPAYPVISPDGKAVVFAARSADDPVSRLYLRPLDAAQAYALDGTEKAQYPFWSPDSRSIGFFVTDQGLKKIAVGGGPAQTICAASNGKGGSWNQDGTIIFAPTHNAPLHRVAAAGGESVALTNLAADSSFNSHRHPQFLPDGKHFLYLARSGQSGPSGELRVGSLDGGKEKVLTHVSEAGFYASGYLLFVNQQTLFAQPLDLGALELRGEPKPLVEDVLTLTSGAATSTFSVSRNGVLTYLRGKEGSICKLVWLDRDGHETGQLGDEALYEDVVFSPDGQSVAVTVRDATAGTRDVWVYEIARNLRTRLTSDPADDNFPVWAPDGKTVYFASNRGNAAVRSIYRVEVGGTGEATLVFQSGGIDLIPSSCSPDGRHLTVMTVDPTNLYDSCVLDLTGTPTLSVLRRTSFEEGAGVFSPDGRWVIYWSTESGRGQVYLAPYPAGTPVRQVSVESGTWSAWRRDQREIFCLRESGVYDAVPVEIAGDDVRLGKPQMLFTHSTPNIDGREVQPTPDGERFLAIMSNASAPPGYADVVFDWPSLLKTK